MSEHASAATIRAAYLALIKRHHPDRAADPSGDTAAAINEAMAVLGDAARRRSYDITRRSRMQTRPFYPPVPVRPRRRPRTRGTTLALAGTAAVAALALTLILLPPGIGRSAALTFPEPASETADIDRTLVQTVVQQAAIDLDWIALHGGAEAAERFSRNCYADLTRASTPPLLLFCAGADARGARLFPTGRPYFADRRRQARFMQVAARLPIKVGDLWLRLESETRFLDRVARTRPLQPAGDLPIDTVTER